MFTDIVKLFECTGEQDETMAEIQFPTSVVCLTGLQILLCGALKHKRVLAPGYPWR